MNKKLYEATQARLRSQALEALAAIEAHLKGTSSDLSGAVDKIAEGAQALAQLEGAMITLQQYFRPAPAPQMPPQSPPMPPQGEPLKVTPEMSPTYKKSLEKQKLKEGKAPKEEKKR